MSNKNILVVAIPGAAEMQICNDVIRCQNTEFAKILEFDEKSNKYKIQILADNSICVLDYNPYSNNYWLYSERGLSKVRAYHPDVWRDSVGGYIICHEKKFINWCCTKCANSSILLNAIKIDQKLDCSNIKSPWYGHLGEKTKKNFYFVSENDASAYSDYKKFIVWRDPIERFLSILNYNLIDIDTTHINRGASKQNYINECIKAARIYNSNLDLTLANQHFLSQHNHMVALPVENNVDYLVRISDLNKFAKQVLGIDDFITTNVLDNYSIKLSDLSESQKKEIIDIFQDDYKLYEKYADKLWLPNKEEKIDKKRQRGKNNNLILLIKSIGYRFFATIATFLIAFLFTGNVTISLSIGLSELLSKILLYFLYDKLWQQLKIGEK